MVGLATKAEDCRGVLLERAARQRGRWLRIYSSFNRVATPGEGSFAVIIGNTALFRYAIYAIPVNLMCAYGGTLASVSALRYRYFEILRRDEIDRWISVTEEDGSWSRAFFLAYVEHLLVPPLSRRHRHYRESRPPQKKGQAPNSKIEQRLADGSSRR
jgi:hypothetical protein